MKIRQYISYVTVALGNKMSMVQFGYNKYFFFNRRRGSSLLHYLCCIQVMAARLQV